MTPLVNYNSTWVLISQNDKRIYFVVETKFTLNSDKFRPEERFKIK
jgi:restriction endonuclease